METKLPNDGTVFVADVRDVRDVLALLARARRVMDSRNVSPELLAEIDAMLTGGRR